MVQFASYNAESHNNLVDIQEAKGYLESAGGIKFINGPLRNAILKHNKGERFGIRLLHSPFDVEEGDVQPSKGISGNQRVVNFGNVAFAVPVSSMSPQERAKIVPTTWVISKPGVVVPVEYSLSLDPINDSLSSSDLELFEDVTKILLASPAAHVLGLSLVYPSLPGIRFKRGNSVITLPLDLKGLVPGQLRFDTLWAFPPQADGAVVQCVESGGPGGQGEFDENF